jgi:hypothetical protein
MIELARRQPFYGLKFAGDSYDCGSKIGFLTANVAYALARADLAPEVPQGTRTISRVISEMSLLRHLKFGRVVLSVQGFAPKPVADARNTR